MTSAPFKAYIERHVELTLTLKLKRRVILERYKDAIEALYS